MGPAALSLIPREPYPGRGRSHGDRYNLPGYTTGLLEEQMDNILITDNERLQHSIDEVTALSTTFTSILIQGETGTGKTELAERIHNHSGVVGEFIVVNCGELVDTLFEAQMFGVKKGAFTGATKDEKGLISLAHGGTLCLDEVQNLTAKGQQALLRVLDRKKIRPVGGKSEEVVNFRLVSTCNESLTDKIEANNFRQDLYFRICEHIATMPPLRERSEDLHALVEDLQQSIKEERSIEIKVLTPEAWEAIYSYDWKGNIRELKNKIVTATIKAGGSNSITAKNLFDKPVLDSMASKYGLFEILGFNRDTYPPMEDIVNKVKYLYLRRLMIEAEGNIAKACRLGDMSRPTLYRTARLVNLDLKEY